MSDSSKSTHLIQALALMTTQIKAYIGDVPEMVLSWQPDESEWSIQMVLAHLVHCEPLFQKRLQRIVDEETPQIQGFSPEEAPPISSVSALSLLADFGAKRKMTLKQIYSYTVEDWMRPAMHCVSGATTLQGQIAAIVDHDTEHLGQMVDLYEMWHTEQEELI